MQSIQERMIKGLNDVRLTDDMETMNSVEEFRCGADDPLDYFLKSEAFKYNRQGNGNTYLVNNKEAIVSYYTLRANAIRIENDDGHIESLSCVELARYAVDSKFQNKGYGKLIFMYIILPKIIGVSEIIGVNMIMIFVDEDNKDAIRFYEYLGFDLASDEIKGYINEDFNDGCNIMYGYMSTFRAMYQFLIDIET